MCALCTSAAIHQQRIRIFTCVCLQLSHIAFNTNVLLSTWTTCRLWLACVFVLKMDYNVKQVRKMKWNCCWIRLFVVCRKEIVSSHDKHHYFDSYAYFHSIFSEWHANRQTNEYTFRSDDKNPTRFLYYVQGNKKKWMAETEGIAHLQLEAIGENPSSPRKSDESLRRNINSVRLQLVDLIKCYINYMHTNKR